MPSDGTWADKALGAYARHIGSVPLRAALLHAALLGTGGLMAGRMGGRLLAARLGDDDVETTKRNVGRLGMAVGALGGLYTGTRGVDFDSLSTAMRSLFDRDYWSRNGDALSKRLGAGRDALDEKTARRQGAYDPSKDMTVTHNSAESKPIEPYLRVIDAKAAAGIVREDPFLSPLRRSKTADLILNSADDQGRASRFGLARTALKAGIGFVPAYLFGSGVGGLLALPPKATKRLSMAGGLAGAVAATGIFDR